MAEEVIEAKKEARAIARFVRMTPRKLRLVINLIRGKKTEEALNILKFTPQRAAGVIKKVLQSAISNAENEPYKMDVESLYVSSAYVDPGPTYKRWMPRARGRASMIRKRTSHITIKVMEAEEVKEKMPTSTKKKKKKKIIRK